MQISKITTSKLSIIYILALLLLLIGKSEAACSFINNAKKGNIEINFDNYTRNPGTNKFASISKSKTANELAAAFGVSNNQVNIVKCTAGESLIFGNSDFIPKGDYLETNLSGVFLNAQGQDANIWKFPKNGGNYQMALPNDGAINSAYITSGRTSSNYNVVFHQIFNGRLSQGGEVHGGRLLNISTSDGLDLMDIYISGFTVTVPSCSVVSYEPNVILGTAFVQKLKVVGQKLNPTKFSISLSCSSTTGLSDGLTPTLTFNGDAVGNDLDVFANNGTAKGVGVQLSYNGNIISPNKTTPLAVVNGLTQNYSFLANIYQTEKNIEPGSIHSVVVFTLDYQ